MARCRVPFCAVYDHTVPTNWVGYSPKKIESRLIPLLTGKEERDLVTTYPRKKRFLRQFRLDFHGMSYRCMNRLARAANATPTDHYTLAPLLYFPKGSAETLLDEFREVWQKMLGLKRLGTEENVLSVLRWRHGWDGMSTEQWLECLLRTIRGGLSRLSERREQVNQVAIWVAKQSIALTPEGVPRRFDPFEPSIGKVRVGRVDAPWRVA